VPPSQTGSNGVPASRVRDDRIDALRGLAIAFIVVQHLGWAFLTYKEAPGLAPTFVGTWSDLSRLGPVWLGLLRYTGPFCVTVFAFVAGYLAVPALSMPFRVFMSRRATRLMLPFLTWTCAYALFPPTRLFFVGRGSVPSFIWASLRSPTGGIAGPVWFLEVLFVSFAVAWLVARLPFRRWALAASAVGALLVPRLLGVLGLPGYFGIAELPAIYPYVAAGLFVGEAAGLWQRRRRGWVLALAAVAYVIAFQLRPLVLGYSFDLPPGLASALASFVRDDLSGVLVSGLGIWLCVELFSLVGHRLTGPLSTLGRHSLGVMGGHLLVIAALLALGVRTPWIVFPAALSVSLGVSLLLNRNRWTRLLFLGSERSIEASLGRQVPAMSEAPERAAATAQNEG